MTHQLIDQILQKTSEVKELYYRLVLVVAVPGNGELTELKSIAEQTDMGLVNVNLELSRRLLTLTARQRSLKVAALLNDIVAAVDSELVLLYHINLLFDPALRQDPLRLLQTLSRRKTIVAVWDGQIQGQHLTYAEPDHPEYRRYPTRELILISPPEVS